MIKLFVKEAANLKEKVIGLIGKDKPYALMLKTRFGIHTFGLKFPIDILILNNANKVVSMRKNLKPNRVFLWRPMHKKVIELPSGIIEKDRIKMNMPIDISIL
ncbi:MAG: DUF192 domain-containing protein [Candidatus Levybacteria bacterium]|nr:DUF192 domain-containing protein [Candidatus Levybacteria bacterium]MDZ4227618.1 DUF192 domain-containing protein [Candidatus Levybacteria bacterium]